MRKNIGKRIVLLLLIGLIATKVRFMYDISYAKNIYKDTVYDINNTKFCDSYNKRILFDKTIDMKTNENSEESVINITPNNIGFHMLRVHSLNGTLELKIVNENGQTIYSNTFAKESYNNDKNILINLYRGGKYTIKYKYSRYKGRFKIYKF